VVATLLARIEFLELNIRQAVDSVVLKMVAVRSYIEWLRHTCALPGKAFRWGKIRLLGLKSSAVSQYASFHDK
jgi:hypothetical protein